MSLPLAQTVKGRTASERLQSLGLELPELDSNAYFVHHRAVGESIHIAGQLPFKDGVLLGQGIVGRDVDLETGKELARQAALNCLAAAVQAAGDLERVRIVQMLVFVASQPDWGLQSQVANAASELLIEVLGENGRHSRTAIGVAGLPLNTPVEIQMVVTAVQGPA
ncbi:RidA family protein [Arthrobacter cupressi]|uniref:Enamine deaminase RidA, house cleaning of reactive enamine intermediates, YjgF/YER057c/UK114 family n=1 Tax=Arthrobacter cupressi TaxID=1045773 RepID=A0A1G8SJG5_9MICC|nr:RidA family protein [Arthrobacter cupressi]NYD78483.1 enamine deaminase RidA (YjgF/YER057c/UK114 family) [Arthrobacter cupressi]SDJ29379.1 Enamine deaminase RidA, house cleaning of reactive enamine intermediates, YjgF/YER057c/UK114 family [Arthrobacter cupressi]